MLISVKTSQSSYNIVLKRGALKQINKYVNLSRKVLIVTDKGVPENYPKTVEALCKEPVLVSIEQGEESKSIQTFEYLLSALVENGFSRSDCIVAVGGGVVGDIAGFAASVYMRGIDFYNVPTTLLSQIDSSIGGKTAINFKGIKNIVGAFYQPKGVIVDSDLLKTLPERQMSNGIAEAIKMATTCDSELFSIIENGDFCENIDIIIERCLNIKKNIVEEDEKECGFRKVLNFGHTIGHAIESELVNELYHGECVAIGMIPMCSEHVRPRLIALLKRYGLPYMNPYENIKALIERCVHDKKVKGETITVVYVKEIGSYEFLEMPFSKFSDMIMQGIK